MKNDRTKTVKATHKTHVPKQLVRIRTSVDIVLVGSARLTVALQQCHWG